MKTGAARRDTVQNAGLAVIQNLGDKTPAKKQEKLVFKDKNDQDIVAVENREQKLPMDTHYEYFMMQNS